MLDEEKATPKLLDIHIGARLRQRRIELGKSQQDIAPHIGITYQQLQKHEKGSNRIPASRLFAMSRLLDVPITYFFEDYDESAADTPRPVNGVLSAQAVQLAHEVTALPSDIRSPLITAIRAFIDHSKP